MAEDRAWMYNGWSRNGRHSDEWVAKTKDFVDHVFALSLTGTVRCPCRRHENSIFLNKERVSLDLCQFGFMPGYEVWEHHGEVVPNRNVEEEENNDWAGDDAMHEMLDSLRPELNLSSEDPATPEVSRFFKLLKDSEEPLHEHTDVSILAFVTRLMAIKSKYFFSNNCYNEILKLLGDVLPKPNKLPKDMYQSKTIIKGLGMDYEKIDVCKNNCMLFMKEHAEEKKCLKCGQSRFVEVVNDEGEKVMTDVAHKQLRYLPLTPRVKRMFLSKKTAMHMRWHKEGVRDNDDLIVHPSDGDAWKALDTFDPEFAADPRNVRIGLATDGFTPFGQMASSYSCWPVFVIPYNLPPSLCMKYEFIFLCLIIPGPDYPGKNLNVMLKPLIEELKELWKGVEAYDVFTKQIFKLRVAYLWSVHDFMAYAIFTGWSTHGRLTCPYCGSDTDCFCLAHGGKITYFDCHRRWLPRKHPFRSDKKNFIKNTVVTKGPPKRLNAAEIYAQLNNLVLNEKGDKYEGFGVDHNWTHICGLWELPYMSSLILVHNIDVMHQESNVAEALIHTCMHFDKTKDNLKARRDLAMLCDRPTQVLNDNGRPPRALFCLTSKDKIEVMRWMKKIKFPDGYAAGLKRAVNLKTGKLTGLKSHDFHILMERIIPVMFRGYMPDAM